jgi:hypothetical protein
MKGRGNEAGDKEGRRGKQEEGKGVTTLQNLEIAARTA